MSKIDDGTGSGQSARVDTNKRLHTQSITETESLQSAEDGDAYNISTGQISFTGDGTLLYIKNNQDQDLVIEALAIGTDGGGTYTSSLRPFVTVVRNPTGGDLITDATNVPDNVNRNFGSSKTLTANTYKGKQAGTLTGGDSLGVFQTSQAGRDYFTIHMVLPKGASIGISATNGLASGTSKIYCAAIVYLKDPASI
jgi:hypothetical protein